LKFFVFPAILSICSLLIFQTRVQSIDLGISLHIHLR
jgi:hypothetical protein